MVGGGRGKEKERRSGEEEKSNNPNLKGGEKHTVGIVGIKKQKQEIKYEKNEKRKKDVQLGWRMDYQWHKQ